MQWQGHTGRVRGLQSAGSIALGLEEGGGDIVRQNCVDRVKHFALVGTNGLSCRPGSPRDARSVW